jgi:protein TonB
MLQQAKWFGLSITLHLTVATGLIFVASRNVDRAPKTIMVVLDTLAPPKRPQQKAVQAPAVPVTRPPVPARRPETAKPEIARQALTPVAPQVQAASPAHEQSRARDLSQASPEVPPAASTNRPRNAVAAWVPSSSATLPGQTTAPSVEDRPTPEKAQQRYLKEHFAYIRDLITKQLAYPPMARKMHWSGKVVVAFIVAEDGTVHNVRVLETSGFPILDRSATETVQNVAPFPKPPVRAEIVVPVHFKMM